MLALNEKAEIFNLLRKEKKKDVFGAIAKMYSKNE